jgi:pimeloyl-ACP methyl ester carboxylesterase
VTLVDIGGRRLHIEIAGRGSPTLVLEPGLLGDSRAWHGVFDQLAAITTTVRWDRAAFGRSDCGPLPQTTQRICDDLDLLLAAAAIPPPYLLVGHSFGACTLRVFAARHPEAIGGLVFVEPSVPDIDERLRPILTTAQWDELQRSWRPVGHPHLVDFERSAREVLATPPLPDVPLLVLFGERFTTFEGWPREAVEVVWRGQYQALAASVPRGRIVAVPDAGHDLFVDQPDRFVVEVAAFVRECQRG